MRRRSAQNADIKKETTMSDKELLVAKNDLCEQYAHNAALQKACNGYVEKAFSGPFSCSLDNNVVGAKAKDCFVNFVEGEIIANLKKIEEGYCQGVTVKTGKTETVYSFTPPVEKEVAETKKFTWEGYQQMILANEPNRNNPVVRLFMLDNFLKNFADQKRDCSRPQ